MKIANKKIAAALKKCAPDIALSVSYEKDPYFQWDGDGPDPVDEGFDPYTVKVTASTVVDGEMVEADNYLGGTYEKPGQFDPDIGGYLPQMLEESLGDLEKSLSGTLKKQCAKARAWLTTHMKREYDKQRRSIEKGR